MRAPTVQTVRTLAKGQIVIPADVRDRYGIRPGTRLELREAKDHLEIFVLPDNPVSAFRGSLKAGVSLADELAAEHRAEVERDASR
jgi:AbrB family looped-hinge helix DNA binding protein